MSWGRRLTLDRPYELGIEPEFAFSNGLRLRPRFVYTLGGFSGFNAGFDLGMRL
jgi:hypothetical protein